MADFTNTYLSWWERLEISMFGRRFGSAEDYAEVVDFNTALKYSIGLYGRLLDSFKLLILHSIYLFQ